MSQPSNNNEARLTHAIFALATSLWQFTSAYGYQPVMDPITQQVLLEVRFLQPPPQQQYPTVLPPVSPKLTKSKPPPPSST